MEEHKPSFGASVSSGIGGSIKGALSGGIVGALGGAVVGAVVGLLSGGLAAIPGIALIGAEYGGAIMGGIGALAGTMTGVVKSREAAQITGEDVVGVAKLSYAQGIATGHALTVAQSQEAEQTTFRDKIMQERAARAAGQQQVH